MRDITDAVLKFRDSARHLWNAIRMPWMGWDDRDDFDQLCAALFRVVVLRPVGFPEATLPSASARSAAPLRFLKVVPKIEDGVPILINRTTPRSGYWDDPVRHVRTEEVDLRFVRFFDWDELGYRDFQYLEVTIEACPPHPHLVGRYALLKATDCRLFVTDDDVD